MKRLLIVLSLNFTSFTLLSVPLPAPGSGNASSIDQSLVLALVAGLIIGAWATRKAVKSSLLINTDSYANDA